ncbi:hypothetical protein, partial [Pseudomonas aeruginosa]|uniref:hypothetical protein n=1 Tax=Pseudomonas aeruginosa TaxID=287 RepID=UPI000BB91D5C
AGSRGENRAAWARAAEIRAGKINLSPFFLLFFKEVLEEIGVLVMLDETKSVYSNFDFGEFVSREFMMEQADLGLYRKEYVDKLISNY